MMSGFPIRKSTDQCLVDSSPWLIAATHVLHRLQMPRHPPFALSSLEELIEISLYIVLAMEFSMYTQLAVLTTIASAIGIVYQFGKLSKTILSQQESETHSLKTEQLYTAAIHYPILITTAQLTLRQFELRFQIFNVQLTE